MKKQNNYITLNPVLKFRLVIMLILGFLSSCESFVEVELPNNQVNGQSVFENAGTATAAMVHIYAELQNNTLLHAQTNSMTTSLGLYTDEMDLFGTSPYYNNTLIPTDDNVLTVWGNSYSLIYAANAVIEGLNSSDTVSQEDKDQLIGEALFTRALIHFYLTNLYGDIPYIETTDYEKNTKASKINVAEVYKKIIQDLLDAKDLIGNAYLTSERTRPNKGTVSALLSRVYLYSEEWQLAEQESSELIADTGIYMWENDVTKVFLKESPSTIWQFKPGSVGGNTLEAYTYIFVTVPPPYVALSSTLINAFEAGDMRMTNWVGSVTDGTDTWYHAYKYKQSENTGTSLEYSKIFRLAEQFLIRSEARARTGNINGAQADLNVIRTRSGLTNTTAATIDDLLDAILQERQIELFVEHGHRFFDLKRMDKADEELSPVKPGWNTTDILFPIPEEEILVNSNLLPQNPGY